MGDKIVTVVIAIADVVRKDYTAFTVGACRSMAEQLEELYPGCVRYDEESQSVVYTGPERNLITSA